MKQAVAILLISAALALPAKAADLRYGGGIAELSRKGKLSHTFVSGYLTGMQEILRSQGATCVPWDYHAARFNKAFIEAISKRRKLWKVPTIELLREFSNAVYECKEFKNLNEEYDNGRNY